MHCGSRENILLNDCENETDPCSKAGADVLRGKDDVKWRWRWRWRGLCDAARSRVKPQRDLKHGCVVSALISDSTDEVKVRVRTSTNVHHVCVLRTNQLRIRHSRICCRQYNNIHRPDTIASNVVNSWQNGKTAGAICETSVPTLVFIPTPTIARGRFTIIAYFRYIHCGA